MAVGALTRNGDTPDLGVDSRRRLDVRWRRDHFNYFKKLGIPGPEPSLIWGNLPEYHSMESYKILGKWIEKYGNMFGFFNGDAPFVVLNDLDFIEYVYVRNFQNFVDRGFMMMTDQMHPVLGKSVMLVGGSEWKDIRSTVAYSMSAAKLKMMMPHMEENADIFIRSLEEHADTGREFNIVPLLEQLSMDYTARGAFGIEEHFQGQPHHPLMKVSREVFRGIMKGPLHMIAQSTTTYRRWMTPFYWLTMLIGEFTFVKLGKQTTKIIERRRKDPSGTLDYDTTMRKLKYLGQFVDETMRLYPPGLVFVTRRAREDFEYKGIKFKAGTGFMVSTYHLQRNPEFWHNAEVFDPERFAPENGASLRKAAYVAFGLGPRNCVGLNFALLIIKYTFARLLLKYRLELGPSQMGSMELGAHGMVSTPARGPWIKLYRV
ncbi:hypothetical protein HPB50_018407 [Hyalomma asiaticum]|uniref:Uncharacterized protein n=1 Tax=Hyalomma asiaticum TaxID=266040 RepID=A0ACB7TAW6_HYAAI|nr:hypothetical protein HPB50_018407 [Hyalomma asiaticum]